ncbi:alpha carbonic anhydrase [Bisporella sp. PMI_857]|nr:alpha carbonic anhydrase [Bisporella sp. PMI_857]
MVSIRSALVAIALSSIFDGVSASCGHGTSLLRRQTRIKRQEGGAAEKVVEVGKFGYLGADGPTQWASLSTEFTGCSTNTIQSPIDVTNTSTTTIAGTDLTIEFPDVAATEFENIGTTVEVVMEGTGAKTTVGGKEFELKQFHFHSPSEHTVDGEYFPLEMHMVHEAADGAIAVIAAHFQLSEGGETTELISTIFNKIGEISNPGTVTEVGPLAFGPVVAAIQGQNLHQYTGSLTTPPCAEGLTFFVTSQQLPLDVASFNKVKAVVGFNSRFVQNTLGSPNLLSLSAAAVAGVASAPVAAEPATPTESAAPAESTAAAAEGEQAAEEPAAAEGEAAEGEQATEEPAAAEEEAAKLAEEEAAKKAEEEAAKLAEEAAAEGATEEGATEGETSKEAGNI